MTASTARNRQGKHPAAIRCPNASSEPCSYPDCRCHPQAAAPRPTGYFCGECGEEHCDCRPGPLIVAPCCCQCDRPIEDNDEAGVCIECGGRNWLAVRETRHSMQALAGLLVAGVVGVLLLAGAVHVIARAAS